MTTTEKLEDLQRKYENQRAMLMDAVNERDALLSVAQMCYRKHHLDDADVGWNELSDKLCNALCNAMGDKEFQRWLAEVSAR